MTASSSAARAEPVGAGTAAQGRWHSRDAQEAQHILSDVYAPHEMTVRGTGRFAFDFELLNSPQLTAGFSTFHSNVTIEVPPPATFYCLCLAPRGAVQASSGSRAATVSSTTATVLNPDEAWRFDDWRSGTLMAVRIGRADLEDDLAALLGRRVERPLEFSAPLDLWSGAGREFGRLLLNMRSPEGESGRLARSHPAIAARMGALVRSAMLVTFPHNYSELLDTEHDRAQVPQAIRRVIDAVEHDPMQVRRAADAARIAHLSLRALESGFERHVGVSPTAYARQVRLARARADLVEGDPGTDTVSAVARRWGFGHAGRFAVAYKERYGETPSETLRRAT